MRISTRACPWRPARVFSLMVLAAILVALGLGTAHPAAAAADGVLLSASFNSSTDGFSYVDDPFDTSQPTYASGTRPTTGGYGASGGLQVALGGVDSNAITGMSGGWSYSLNLPAPETGVRLSFRYKLSQSATYEFDEYSRVLVRVDGVQYGRGAKNYVDHVGGDGSSSQGNSSSYLPTTDWQQVELYVGGLAAGDHTIVLGGYNNKKNASDESTTIVIDDVLLTSGNPAPAASAAEILAGRVDIDQFLAFNRGVAQFDDRCRGSGMGCVSYDASANPSPSSNYMKALAWVETQLQAMGYTTVRHSFTSDTGGINLYATKPGSVTPTEMYMISTHLDGRGGGDAFNDDGSGVALVLEIARVLSAPDVTTDKSVRFIFWDKEEVGLYGSKGYASSNTASGGRRALQGTPDEPTWLGLITHDMILYDHGADSVTTQQSAYADMDVEWRAGTTKAADSMALALKWAHAAGAYAPDYPATAYNYSTNTDDTPFQPYVASISVRENRRSLTSGDNAEWINPYYHTTSDIESSYTRDDDGDGKRDDIELGYNTVRTTLGLIAELAGAHVTVANEPPSAVGQAVSTNEDTPLAITLTGSDVDNDPLTFSVATQPSHGTLSGTAPNLTYTPAPDYAGPDSFTFIADDGSASSAPAAISITVNPVNDAPVAVGQAVGTACNTPLAITLAATDVEGAPLSFVVTGGPARGALSGSAPALTYTPGLDYSGADSFTFTADDGFLTSTPATIDISVGPCGTVLPLPFSDDFETDLGWVVNPAGTDSARSGAWQRTDPQPTAADGPKQLGDTPSGAHDLVTGALAGNNAGKYDVDGGVTSVRSPHIQLPAGADIVLSFSYYFAHARNASSADYFRVQVVGATGATVLEVRGTNADVDAAWTSFSASLTPFAGQTVYLLIEAADLANDSLVEAAVDDVTIGVAAPSSALLSADFAAGEQGFAYADDAFRGTAQGAYASGAWIADGGHAGGALQVRLGGIDNAIVDGISGGWSAGFALAEAGPVRLSFWFILTQSPDYDDGECSEALVAVDGALYGVGAADFVARVCGNGNGGIAETTGWQLVSLDLGPLDAGSHTVAIGGYNNRKSYANEATEILIDDVIVAR